MEHRGRGLTSPTKAHSPTTLRVAIKPVLLTSGLEEAHRILQTWGETSQGLADARDARRRRESPIHGNKPTRAISTINRLTLRVQPYWNTIRSRKGCTIRVNIGGAIRIHVGCSCISVGKQKTITLVANSPAINGDATTA